MAFQPELIDNPSFISKGAYERFIKKQTHKYRRRKVKEFIRDYENKLEPNDKYYRGWTT